MVPRAVVPPECASILFRVSFLTGAVFFIAAALQVYDGMVVTAAVFLCSVNHWRNPVYGWRRNIDIANNVICLAYQTWRAVSMSPSKLHYTIGFLMSTYTGVAFFFIGLYLDTINIMYGTYAHAVVHIMGNIGNIILYLGISGL
jgi:hypothetical protein